MKKCFKIFGCATVLSTALAFPAFAEIPAQYSELIPQMDCRYTTKTQMVRSYLCIMIIAIIGIIICLVMHMHSWIWMEME